MTTRRLALMLIALAAVGSMAVAHAQRPEGPPPRGPEGGPGFGRGPRFAEELGLTEDQKAQMESFRKKNEETVRPLMETARQAREAFHQALEADGADATAVGQAALAMHAAEKKLRAAHEAVFAQMKSILTPEQLQKLEQGRERRFGRPHPPMDHEN